MSYSIGPGLTLDETTSRMHSLLSYSAGFTFYQKTSDLNAANQNASIDFRYRLSPHVTFTARDAFQKTSSVFNQPDLGSAGIVSGGAQEANFSVIAPVADLLTNSGNVGISYQFSMNGMIGASGTFSNLHYPNPAQVSGLYDSSSQGGSAFYSHRISRVHYLGVTYRVPKASRVSGRGTQRNTDARYSFFYSLYLNSRISVSFFGGPQYSDTIQPPFAPGQFVPPPLRSWTPAAGGSLGWQGRLNTLQ